MGKDKREAETETEASRIFVEAGVSLFSVSVWLRREVKSRPIAADLCWKRGSPSEHLASYQAFFSHSLCPSLSVSVSLSRSLSQTPSVFQDSLIPVSVLLTFDWELASFIFPSSSSYSEPERGPTTKTKTKNAN